MRKFILILGVFITISFATNAQNQDSLISKISIEACDLIAKEDISNLSAESRIEKLTTIITPIFEKYLTEIFTTFNIAEDDHEAIEEIGNKVGVKLATECRVFIDLIKKSNPDN